MLARKGDANCVKMIDFGLSKDFSNQETMKTMSGSVSEKFLHSSNFANLMFSLTTSPRKSSCRTTTQKLTSGLSVSSSTLCSLAKSPSQVTQNLKSSET